MSLIKLLEDLPDIRRAQGRMYKLNHVLVSLCRIVDFMRWALLSPHAGICV